MIRPGNWAQENALRSQAQSSLNSKLMQQLVGCAEYQFAWIRWPCLSIIKWLLALEHKNQECRLCTNTGKKILLLKWTQDDSFLDSIQQQFKRNFVTITIHSKCTVTTNFIYVYKKVPMHKAKRTPRQVSALTTKFVSVSVFLVHN